MLRGGFGQYLLLDPNPAVIRVPDEMTTERALMSVIGIHTTMSGLRKINGPDPGDTVVIQGSGPIGMGALIQSRIRGAAHVIMIGSPSHRLDLAKELGADETIDLADYPTPDSRIEKIKEMILDEDFLDGNGTESTFDIKADYMRFIFKDLKLKRPIRIGIDCGNGAASVIAEQVYNCLLYTSDAADE